MQDHEQADARDIRDGGWYWVQRELQHVFTPLIGPEASWLYTVICDLVPQKVENPLLELTIRAMQKTSGLSIGTVHRKLAVLTAIGMVEEEKRGRGKPSTFTLVSLRKLAALGTVELTRRLSVPRGNSGDDGGGATPTSEVGEGWSESPTGSGDTTKNGEIPGQIEASSPEGSGEMTVPGGNTEQYLGEEAQNPAEMTLVDLHLFQKRGGSVPKKGGSCSTVERPLILNQSIQKQTTPLPPEIGGSEVFQIAAAAEEPQNGNGQGKNFPNERQEQSKSNGAKHPGEVRPRYRLTTDDPALVDAIQKVMRECSLSSPRLGIVIERAMQTEASKTDKSPDWDAIAESMIDSRREYTKFGRMGLLRVMPNVDKFFSDALWRDIGLWAVDEKKLAEMRNARVGT